MTDILQL